MKKNLKFKVLKYFVRISGNISSFIKVCKVYKIYPNGKLGAICKITEAN